MSSSPGLERPGLGRALAYARAGNQLVIWRLDRLGRSLKDFIEQVGELEQHGIELVSLLSRDDTLTPARQGAVPDICGVFAEFERNLISERTKAGLAATRARGRKPKMTPEQLVRAASLIRTIPEQSDRTSRAKRMRGGSRPKCLPDGAYRPLIAVVQKDAIRQRPGHKVLQLDGRSRTSEP